MYKTFASLLFLVVATAISLAGPPTLKVPEEVPVPLYAFGQIRATGEFEFIKWKLPKPLKFTTAEGPELLFTGPPGTYEVLVWASNKEGITDLATVRITIGDGKVDPTPKPNVDPTPKPNVDPPFDGQGFRVLIIAETGDRTKMSPAQTAIIYSKTIRDYLNQKCVLGPDKITKEWRIYDPDTDVTGDGEVWRKAMKRKRDSVPWILIANGTSAYEGPLPTNIDDTLTLLKKYGE